MAIYIPIRLIEDSADSAVYEYSQPVLGPDPARAGRFHEIGTNIGRAQIDKGSGEIHQLQGHEWDTSGSVFARVAKKLQDCQKAGNFPSKLSFSA